MSVGDKSKCEAKNRFLFFLSTENDCLVSGGSPGLGDDPVEVVDLCLGAAEGSEL